MKCFNCSAEIPVDSIKCPFCGTSVESSKRDFSLLSKKIMALDERFGLRTDYATLGTDKLQDYLKEIVEKLNNLETTLEEKKVVEDHIDKVADEVCSRIPEAKTDYCCPELGSDFEIVKFLLKLKPAQYSCAAVKLRQECDKALEGSYNFKKVNKTVVRNGQSHLEKSFPYPYDVMFSKITDNGTASFLKRARTVMNLLIHDDEKNKDTVREMVGSDNELTNYLLKINDEHKRLGLIH